MFDAVLAGFLAGFIAYILLSGFQELRLWRLSVAVKQLMEVRLGDVRRIAANKRWDTNAEMEELLALSKKKPKPEPDDGPDPDDKWGDWLKGRR